MKGARFAQLEISSGLRKHPPPNDQIRPQTTKGGLAKLKKTSM
jgi:hypothetical protein